MSGEVDGYNDQRGGEETVNIWNQMEHLRRRMKSIHVRGQYFEKSHQNFRD